MLGGGNLNKLQVLCFWACLFWSFSSPGSPFFSRWVGVLHHDELKRDQLVKLDFVVSRGQENELELLAMFTLQFGDFKSSEYITYHFDKVRHNILTGVFVFEQTGQPVGLTITRYSAEELVAEVRSLTGVVGNAVLRREEAAKPRFPILQALEGNYRGNCGKEPASLQLYTFRSSKDLVRAAHPFAAYEVKGNLGRITRDCERCKSLIQDQFTNADYDFFTGQLRLSGNSDLMSCAVGDEGLLSCSYATESCQFKRMANISAGKFSPPISHGSFNSLESEKEVSGAFSQNLTSGHYRGYIHHEYLDAYQRADLKLSILPPTPTAGTRMSAVATLYFGNETTGERIHYKFFDQPYINPIVSAPVIVLRQSQDDVDAVIQITSVGEDGIKGIWYSILFGRVGRFDLRKDGALPNLSPEAKLMRKVSGLYSASKIDDEAPAYELHLQTIQGETPLVSENPFFPNTFRGSIRNPQVEGRPKAAILGGSYDFYTGKLGFTRRVDFYGVAGSFESNFIGHRNGDGIMSLSYVSPFILNPLPVFGRPSEFSVSRN